MEDKNKFYQIKKIEDNLARVMGIQETQGKILSGMKDVLAEISSTMKNLTEIVPKQIRLEVEVSALKRDIAHFKEFMDKKPCVAHTTQLKVLNDSDASQNKNVATIVIGLIIALAAGFIGWLSK